MHQPSEKVRDIKESLAKLDPTQNADTFHSVIGSALIYLGYRGAESPIVAYNRRKKEKIPIKDYKDLQKLDPNLTIFLREEEYKNNGTVIQVTTIYLTNTRVRGKKASLWFIRANSSLDLKRKTTRKEDLVKKIREGMRRVKTCEERLDYGRAMIEKTLEEALIKGSDNKYYLNFRDINELVKPYKQG